MKKSAIGFFALALLTTTACVIAQPVTGNLGVSTLTLNPTSATSGEAVGVSFRVTNFGPGLGQLTRYEVFVDGTRQVNQSPLTVIANGSGVNVNTSVNMPTVAQGSSRSVELIARITGAGDPNTSNNETSRFITVSGPSLADLTCSTPQGWSGPLIVSNQLNATATPATLTSGVTLYASFGYQTTAGPTPAGVPVRLLLNGSPVLNTPFSPLQANQSRTERNVSLGVLTPGAYTLELRLDPDGLVPELNNANNTCTFVFQVVPPPQADLTPFTPANWPSPAFTTGTLGSLVPKTQFLTTDTVYFNAAWANLGNLSAGPFVVSLRANGALLDSLSDPGLPAQTFRTLTDVGINGFPPGVFQIVLGLDETGVIAESNETNNTLQATITVTVPCPADFDGVGGVAINDIFSFLNAWFANDLRADVDGVDGLTINDVFAFLNLWFAGC